MIEDNPELRLLLELCDNKGIWLRDVFEKNLSSSELTLWIAFYKIRREEAKRKSRKDRGLVSGEKYGSLKGSM